MDGVLLEGSGSVDESAITGESIPVDKQAGDKVIGATINQSGYFRMRADKVGDETALSQIIKLVDEATSSKAPIAKLADTWADVYDTANHDERRAILQQFIAEIRVRKDYKISITLNASFNQVEQLKSVSIYDGAEIFEEISEKGA